MRWTPQPENLQWSTRILPEDATGYSLTMAPRVVKDKVIVGLAGAEFTPHRGFFAAFDVNTGREVWRFYTVPGDPVEAFRKSRTRKGRQDLGGRVVEIRRRRFGVGQPVV